MRCTPVCSASQQQISLSSARRDVLMSIAALSLLGNVNSPARAAGTPEVGTYLPPASDGLVLFVPDSKKTPALRAGAINPNTPYSFALPAKFKEKQVANISSGNFCMPNCAEPWTEVVFENEVEGKVQVQAAPLVKLTNKVNASVTDLGSPRELLDRVGPFITGTQLDEEDVVAVSSKVLDDNRPYYYYELYAPYGTTAPHTLTACVAKGEVLYIFVVSATDKQWPKAEKTLRKVVESFRA